jgi:hypothetical protein
MQKVSEEIYSLIDNDIYNLEGDKWWQPDFSLNGLRPRGSECTLTIIGYIHIDFRLQKSVVLPNNQLRGSIPSTLRLMAYLLAVLRLKLCVATQPPRTCYPMAGLPFGTGFTPA